MVSVNPFSAISTIGDNANSAGRGIADNFDTFLSLLTTQLRNQNPLDPLDTNQFTQQLVQFTEVEQAVRTNDNLETLLKLSVASAITSAVSYIGKQVTLTGNTSQLRDGSASWSYQAGADSPGATFTIRDASGNTVFTETRSVQSGSNSFDWDGRTGAGRTAPDGSYTLSIDSTSNGSAADIAITTKGIVSGVDMSGSEPVFLVGDRQVKFDEVKLITLPSG